MLLGSLSTRHLASKKVLKRLKKGPQDKKGRNLYEKPVAHCDRPVFVIWVLAGRRDAGVEFVKNQLVAIGDV